MKRLFPVVLFFLLSTQLYSQNNWQKIISPKVESVYDIHISENGFIFIASTGGIFRLKDGIWKKVLGHFSDNRYKQITTNSNGDLYVIANKVLQKTTNFGDSWSTIRLDESIEKLGNIFIDQNDDVYISTLSHSGKSRVYKVVTEGHKPWETIGQKLIGSILDLVIDDNGNLFSLVNNGASWENGIYRMMRQFGETNWQKTSSDFENMDVCKLILLDNGSLIVGVDNSLFRSDDNGNSWYLLADNLEGGLISDISTDSEDNLFVSTRAISPMGEIHGSHIYYYENSTGSIHNLNPISFISSIFCLSNYQNNEMYIGTLSEGLMKYTDYLSVIRKVPDLFTQLQVSAFFIDSDLRIFCGSPCGIFIRDRQTQNWRTTITGLTIDSTSLNSFAQFNVREFAQKPNGDILAIAQDRLYLLNEEEKSWEEIECPYIPRNILVTDESDIFISTRRSIVRKLATSDTWGEIFFANELDYGFIEFGNSFAINDEYILVANSAGVYKSSDNGTSWESMNSNLKFTYDISLSSNSNVYCVDFIKGIYRTPDWGNNWQSVNIGIVPYTIKNIESNSTGQTFIGESNFIGLTEKCNGVFVTNDSSIEWDFFNNGISEEEIDFLAFDKNDVLYAANKKGKIYRTNHSTTDIVDDETLPNIIELSQNYPNPFNPSTKIKFSIPGVETTRRVVSTKLALYDILGREIKTLLNKKLTPGRYEVEFNGENLSSGVYLYRLQVGDTHIVKKMILLR